jgi:nucleoid-associated protein YgaU
MMRSIGILVGAAALLALVATGLNAQSLLDNEFYKKAVAQRQQSEQAYQDGDYDAAASLAKESKGNFEKSDAYVEKMMGFYRANGWLQRANERFAYAKELKAAVNFESAFEEASRDIANAKIMLDTEEYVRSVYLSKEAIAALQNIPDIMATAPETVTPTEPQVPPLPSSYTVRLNMARRDCFWRIAGFPFVYNDPWKWKTLYEANKSILTDPKNPDLIEPGQVFTIPSLQGEEREGEYDPEKTYTPLTVK